MPKITDSEKQIDEYNDFLEPLLAKPEAFYNGDTKLPKVHAAIVAVACIVIVGVALFFPFENAKWIWKISGFALGVILFVPLYFAVVNTVRKRKETDPEYVSLKERYGPNQRLRISLGVFVGTLILLVILFSQLPSIAGGIAAVAVTLGLYAFGKRTRAEFEAFIEGEVDPRDLAVNETMATQEANEADEAEKLAEAAKYLELVNSLPEDQRKILLNPKLNGMIAVVDEDDMNKKNKGFFGRDK